MDKKYGKISNIVVDDLGSWQNKIFLTFDIDWAHDEIINDCYELISQYNIFRLGLLPTTVILLRWQINVSNLVYIQI